MENKQAVGFFIAGVITLVLAGWVYLSFQPASPKQVFAKKQEGGVLDSSDGHRRNDKGVSGNDKPLQANSYQLPATLHPTYPLIISGHTIRVELARSETEKERGLSGRQELTEGSGMLFMFDAPDRYKFWRKDMLISLDLLWIDKDGMVVDLRRSLSPDTYPAIFEPSVEASYVLEVPNQTIDTLSIKRGDRVDFSSVPKK